MKLSVIVPVYNVEKFLPRCLDSLLRQGLELGEYEVICVNDGSPDNCAAILAEYEQKHPDIFKVITQENKGLGGARNTGMKVVQGDWVTFLDSDDYIIDYGYKYILDHFCEEGIDVIHFNCMLTYTDGKSLYDSDAKPDGKVSFDGDGAEAYNYMSLPYVWLKFYKHSFLDKNGVFFETAFMEDEPFNFDVFRHSPHLRIVTSTIYRYEQGNPTSLLTTNDKEKILHQLKWLLFVVDKMNNYLQEDNGVIANAAKRNINTFLKAYYNKMLKARLTRDEWKECIRQLKIYPVNKVNSLSECSLLGKVIVHIKNWSGTSYCAYLMVEFLLRVVFTNILRPRIIASYSSKQ